MSGLIKNILKPSYIRSTSSLFSLKASVPASQPFRSISAVCSSFHRKNELFMNKNVVECICNCQAVSIHTKGGWVMSKAASQKIDLTQGEKELAEFLTEEIAAEKQLQGRTVPNEVNGFKIKFDGPEVTLVKHVGDETITLKINVNHSVGEETEYDTASESGSTSKDEIKPIVNRPPFDVEIKRGGKILGFRCTMVVPPPKETTSPEDPYNDLFTIDEIVLSNGEWKSSDYHVPGEIMDGTLYDLLMNMLEDKGIGNELIEKLTVFSTDYEHTLYIHLLEELQKFVTPAK